jgi:hypothetical protein
VKNSPILYMPFIHSLVLNSAGNYYKPSARDALLSQLTSLPPLPPAGHDLHGLQSAAATSSCAIQMMMMDDRALSASPEAYWTKAVVTNRQVAQRYNYSFVFSHVERSPGLDCSGASCHCWLMRWHAYAPPPARARGSSLWTRTPSSETAAWTSHARWPGSPRPPTPRSCSHVKKAATSDRFVVLAAGATLSATTGDYASQPPC